LLGRVPIHNLAGMLLWVRLFKSLKIELVYYFKYPYDLIYLFKIKKWKNYS